MAHGWKPRGNSLWVDVLLGLGVGVLLVGAGLGVRHWQANRSSEHPDAPLLGGSGGPKPAAPPAGVRRPATPTPSLWLVVSPLLGPTAVPAGAVTDTSALSEKVRLYLSGASVLLHQAEIPHLGGAALEGLLQQFDQCHDPVVALRLARVLSRTPDFRVANTLMHKLVNGFAGQQLTPDQKHAVAGIAGSLGWLAGRFDSVYVFLKEHGTTPAFWRSHRKWSALNVPDHAIDRLLAGRSWLSLGASGRPEANAYLLEFLNGRRSLEDSNLAAAVAEAAFHFHLSKAESPGAPDTGGVEDYMDKLHAWINQMGEGQRWWTWYRAQVGLKQPPGSPGFEGTELKK